MLAPYPMTSRFLIPLAHHFALSVRNEQTLPEGIVNWTGSVSARAHILNLAKAGAASVTPSHLAPKSVTMSFETNAGADEAADVSGAKFAAKLPAIELSSPELY